MAKTKRTAVVEKVKALPKTVEIPLTLLKHLVRLTGNRQAKMFLREATGATYKTKMPIANVVEPEVAKVEKKERGKLEQKEKTKDTPLAKIKKRVQDAKNKKLLEKETVDKNFNKS